MHSSIDADPSPAAVTVREEKDPAALQDVLKNEKSSNEYTEIWSAEQKDDLQTAEQDVNNENEILSLKSQLDEKEQELAYKNEELMDKENLLIQKGEELIQLQNY